MITPNDVATAKLALGAKLAAFRHAAALNQHGLAKLVITSRSSIANIESGRQVDCPGLLGTLRRRPQGWWSARARLRSALRTPDPTAP